MIKIKRFNKLPRWVQILAGILVISLLIGAFGLIFSLSSTKKVAKNEGAGELSSDVAKIGKYRYALGVLNYTYEEDYKKLLDKELGFKSVRESLGALPGKSDAWTTIMYDRGYDPYLSFGKDIDAKQYLLEFDPVSYDGKKIVFDTDFCYNGSKGAGEYCSDSDPTWHTDLMICPPGIYADLSIRFYDNDENSYLVSVNNRAHNLGYLKLGEWYNLRAEIISGAGSDPSEYKIYIDNALVASFSGSGFQAQITDADEVAAVLKLRKDSLGASIYLDNTYFSKIN